MHSNETIAAISTPAGRGGIGVVRLSGDDALHITRKLVCLPGNLRRSQNNELTLRPWRARLAELTDDQGNVIDHVLVTYFQKPRSYTGEDMVEISCHGSPVVLDFLLGRCLARGARLAEPGEFTMRAFLNGRMDLTQAEAVGDLIEAQTLYQAKVAAKQMEG